MMGKIGSRLAGLLTGMVIAAGVYSMDSCDIKRVSDTPKVTVQKSVSVPKQMSKPKKKTSSLGRPALELLASRYLGGDMVPITGEVIYDDQVYQAEFRLSKVRWRTKQGLECILGEIHLRNPMDELIILSCNYGSFERDFRIPDAYVEVHQVRNHPPNPGICTRIKNLNPDSLSPEDSLEKYLCSSVPEVIFAADMDEYGNLPSLEDPVRYRHSEPDGLAEDDTASECLVERMEELYGHTLDLLDVENKLMSVITGEASHFSAEYTR